MEDAVQQISRAIAGEDTAGPVRSMSAWGQAYDQQFGAGISEAGDGLTPIGLIAISAPFYAGHFAVVLDQPGAAGAGDDLLFQDFERSQSRLLHRGQDIRDVTLRFGDIRDGSVLIDPGRPCIVSP